MTDIFLDFGIYKLYMSAHGPLAMCIRTYVHVLAQIEVRHYLESTAAQTCASAITSILYYIYIYKKCIQQPSVGDGVMSCDCHVS